MLKTNKKRGRGAAQATRTSDAEVAVQREVQRFLALDLKSKYETKIGTDEEDESFFAWYDALHSIGGGAITGTLIRMKVLFPEHISRDVYSHTKETSGEEELRECVSLAMCITHEVLDQLARAVRKLKAKWPKPVRTKIFATSDVIVVRYAINMILDLPPDVMQRCRGGYNCEEIEIPSDILE